jgi:glycosyltransferase involved in cell wall biosynthesis
MRILFCDFSLPYLLADSDYPVGGFAVQLEQWLQGLAALGAESGVLTCAGANAFVERTLPFELIESYDPKVGVRVIKYFYSYIPSMLAGARAFRPDAILQSCASVHTGILAYVARRLRVPFAYRVASDSEVDGRIKNVLKPYENFAYRRGVTASDLVVCQNGYQVEQVERTWPEKSVLHLQNALQIPSGLPAPRSRAERSYIAWLGVFRKEKNLPLLARVAKSLPDQQFRVAGMADAGADSAILAAIGELQSLPNVSLVGYLRRHAIEDFLGRATALLCTSHFEGFSNTFLEAFAAGTPVVTRKEVDPDGIVERLALGAAASSDADLTMRLSHIALLEAHDFGRLSDRCRFYVEKNHSPRVAMTRLVDALEETVARRQKRAGR